MWNLDNETVFARIHSFNYSKPVTYGDSRPGHRDADKREGLRHAVIQDFPRDVPSADWWAFRISIRKTGTSRFDVDNVNKIVIDTFCRKQIEADKSPHKRLGLYDDDTIDYVRMIQTYGERSSEDSMLVEIFGRKPVKVVYPV